MKAICQNLLKFSCQNQSVDKVQLVTLTFWPQKYRYLKQTILHLCIKYESSISKSTQSIVSEPKCWQSSSVVTLTFDPKCIGVFLSLSCIYVCDMKAVCWKLLNLSCQNQSLDKVPLWTWPLDPKMYRSPSSHHLASIHEKWKQNVENYSCYCIRTKMLTKFSFDLGLWPQVKKAYSVSHHPASMHKIWHYVEKQLKLASQNKMLTNFSCDLDLWTPKCICIFIHLTILHLCLKYEC